MDQAGVGQDLSIDRYIIKHISLITVRVRDGVMAHVRDTTTVVVIIQGIRGRVTEFRVMPDQVAAIQARL